MRAELDSAKSGSRGGVSQAVRTLGIFRMSKDIFEEWGRRVGEVAKCSAQNAKRENSTDQLGPEGIQNRKFYLFLGIKFHRKRLLCTSYAKYNHFPAKLVNTCSPCDELVTTHDKKFKILFFSIKFHRQRSSFLFFSLVYDLDKILLLLVAIREAYSTSDMSV